LNQIKSYLSTLAGFDTEFAKPLTKGSNTDVAMKRGRAVFAVTNVSYQEILLARCWLTICL